jgi:hypothetical protein
MRSCVVEFLGIAHGQDARPPALSALTTTNGFSVMPYSLYLRRTLVSIASTLDLTQSSPLALVEVDLAAAALHRVDEPGVHAQQLGELLGHFFVALEVPALAPHGQPACSGGSRYCSCRCCSTGHAGGEVVVEQDGAGVEVLEPQAAALAHQRLQREFAAVGQGQHGGRLQGRIQRPQPHVQAGLVEDRTRRCRFCR